MKITKRGGKCFKRGASLVEFAIVFPVAMLLIFSLIDISMYFYYQGSMTNVVRSTLRYTVTGRYEGNTNPAGTNPDWFNRKASAIREARRSLTPLLSIDAPKGELIFMNPDNNTVYGNDADGCDLGGPGAKVKVVMRQKVYFLTPFAYLIGSTNSSGQGKLEYNLEVSTTYKSEGYTPKEDVTTGTSGI